MQLAVKQARAAVWNSVEVQMHVSVMDVQPEPSRALVLQVSTHSGTSAVPWAATRAAVATRRAVSLNMIDVE